MESYLSEILLLIPENCLIIELVQAVYVHIPILLCQQQCLRSEVLFLVFSGFHLTAAYQLIRFNKSVHYKVYVLILFCMFFETVSKLWL